MNTYVNVTCGLAEIVPPFSLHVFLSLKLHVCSYTRKMICATLYLPFHFPWRALPWEMVLFTIFC